jgi:hypothetical protein
MAGRGLSVNQINASASGHRVVAPLIEMLFDSGTLHLAAFRWNVTDGPITYTAANLIIAEARESAGSREGLEVSLSGLDPAVIALAVSEPYQGRVIRLLKGYIQPDSNGLIDVARVCFLGRMRNMTIIEDNNKAQVTVSCEHYEVELQRPNPLRYTDAAQQDLYPGDLGCQYSAVNADKQVVWPSAKAQRYGNPQPSYYVR